MSLYAGTFRVHIELCAKSELLVQTTGKTRLQFLQILDVAVLIFVLKIVVLAVLKAEMQILSCH